MDIKEIQNLIKFVAKSGASEVKLEMEDVKITIKTGSNKIETTIVQAAPAQGSPQMGAPTGAAPVAEEAGFATPESEDAKVITIKSPISGTFYRKPSPDKPKCQIKLRQGDTRRFAAGGFWGSFIVTIY